MRNVAPWQTTVVLLASLTVALVVLEAVARAWAPPKQDDPRLGLFGFWLWVSVVAATTSTGAAQGRPEGATDHSQGERREIPVGHSSEERLLLVSFGDREGRIRKLPGAERVQADDLKLRGYLLSPTHPVGRFKARVLRRGGLR